jgi:hypothetical protein
LAAATRGREAETRDYGQDRISEVRMSRGTHFNRAGIDSTRRVDDEGQDRRVRLPSLEHGLARAKSRIAWHHLSGFVDLCLGERGGTR